MYFAKYVFSCGIQAFWIITNNKSSWHKVRTFRWYHDSDGWLELSSFSFGFRGSKVQLSWSSGSGLLCYLQPSPCHLSPTPMSSKSYTWSARAGIRGHVYPGPWDQTSGSSSTKGWWWHPKATGKWKSLRITVKLVIQNSGPDWPVSSASAPSSKPSRNQPETERSKNRSSSVEIALLTRLPDRCSTYLYSQRVFWKHERTGTAEPVDCNMDGCHPHAIIGDTNSGRVGCSAT